MTAKVSCIKTIFLLICHSLSAGGIEERVQVVYGYPMYLSHVFGDRGDGGFGGRSYEYHPLTTMGFEEIQKLLIRHMSQLKKRYQQHIFPKAQVASNYTHDLIPF